MTKGIYSEMFEMSTLPRIRDSWLGRERHGSHYPPSSPPHDLWRYYYPPPPSPPHHRYHRHHYL